MTTRVLTMNEKDTLSVAVAIIDLEHVLRLSHPHVGGLQEWNAVRDSETEKALSKLGCSFTRGPRGGGPVFWQDRLFDEHAARSIRLSAGEFVGHLVGRKTRLPASWCTEVTLDVLGGGQLVVLNAHMTAEVQNPDGSYRKDPGHLLRVMRHKREKRRLGRRARHHKRKGRRVFVVADTNFDGMTLGGFTSCWSKRDGNTLGWRAPDIVFTDREPKTVATYPTHSDHRAVCAIY